MDKLHETAAAILSEAKPEDEFMATVSAGVLEKDLEKIAKQHLGIDTLKTRHSDRLDFHDIAVWSILEALKAAYELGKKSSKA